MATKVDIAETNISASQMKEFWRLAALPEGSHVNRDTFQDYLERRNPFVQREEITPAKPTPLFSTVATTELGAVAGKKTKKCFVDISRYTYRDAGFDDWLPANQPNADACVITTLAPSREWTFAEAAAAVLVVPADTPIKTLGELLIKRGHTITLPQDEEMMEKTENGEKIEMRVNGYGNFCFVETGDPKNPVSVGHVYRGERAWHAYVHSLGDGNRWRASHRLLVRNLDASKLGR